MIALTCSAQLLGCSLMVRRRGGGGGCGPVYQQGPGRDPGSTGTAGLAAPPDDGQEGQQALGREGNPVVQLGARPPLDEADPPDRAQRRPIVLDHEAPTPE